MNLTNATQADSRAPAHRNPNIWAVVVTYNPTPDFEANIQALVPQVNGVIIVDNHSAPAIRAFVEKVACSHQAATIWNPQNVGIAAALNTGVRVILTNHTCHWILLLDQDSRVSPDFVATCLGAYKGCPFRNDVLLVGANYQLSFRNLSAASSSNESTQFREMASLMTSGTLVKSKAFSVCGGFDESLFMDYVDHDFCFRVRRHGFRIIQVNNAVLRHQLGTPTSHQLLGKRFTTSNYNPSRRYHNARNRIILYRRYLLSETNWIVCDWVRWFREIVKMILVETDRWGKLTNISRGIWDGSKALTRPARSSCSKCWQKMSCNAER